MIGHTQKHTGFVVAPLDRDWSAGWKVALACGATGLALLLTLQLQKWLQVPFPVLFLAAVTGSAWIGGRVSGWSAVVLSTLAIDFFFTRPLYSLWIEPEDIPYFLAFAGSAMVGNWFGGWWRRREVSLLRERSRLQSTVQARNAALEQADRHRRLAEQRWQAVFDNELIGVLLLDEQGGVIASNQRCRQLLRQDGAQDENLPHGGCFSEWLGPGPGVAAVLAGLRDGRRSRATLEVRRDTAGGPAWLRIHFALVAGTPDFPRFISAFCEDISERKRAEEAARCARNELARASRLTMVGELGASIAHEVNQPLSAIVTNGNACQRWLAAQPPDLAEVARTVGWIVRDAKRAGDVVARLRALMNKGETLTAPLDFNEIVSESLDLLQGELGRGGIEVAVDLAVLPRIMGERIQLQQVLLNLLLNAIEALEVVAGRARRIEIRTRTLPDGGIETQIRDNGPGAGAALDRLFDAFFTTKAQGTGLGLWISRSIVENHGGSLSATAAPQGMCFHIVLPPYELL